MPPDRPSPDRVIPFYSLALGDLVYPKASLIVWCGSCRREATLDAVPVLVKRGPDFSVKALDRVLTCAGCGRKGFANVRVEWL